MRRGASIGASILVIAVLAGAAAWLSLWNENAFEGPATVIDGDSLRMFDQELRLAGLDAPELDQTCLREGRPWRCGAAARAALEKETRSANLRCTATKRDRYGRWLVTCRAGGADIGAALVRAGAAIAYGAYQREEAEARDARRGLWASTFERPDAWRRANPR